MVFGQVAPRSPKWWAPWAYTTLFGGVAGFLTYGASIGELPPDRAGGTSQGTFVTALFWIATVLSLVFSIVITVRRFRRR